MSLRRVLEEQYKWCHPQAVAFSAFLLPMLRMNPQERATAAQSLQHEWVKERQRS